MLTFGGQVLRRAYRLRSALRRVLDLRVTTCPSGSCDTPRLGQIAQDRGVLTGLVAGNRHRQGRDPKYWRLRRASGFCKAQKEAAACPASIRRRGRQSGYRRTGQCLDAHDAASGPNARSPRALNKLRATWESAYRGDSHDRPRFGVLQAFLISIFCCFFATSAGFGKWMCNTPLSNFASTFAGSGSNGRGIARLNEP